MNEEIRKLDVVRCEWSDGEVFHLKPNQVWEDLVNGDSDVEIIGLYEDIDGQMVLNAYDQGGENECMGTDFVHGVDGFVDYLETNCYTLKENV